MILMLPFCCFAQNDKKVALHAILEAITKKDGAKFSYIEEELKVYNMVPPGDDLSLQQKLHYIEQRTRLKFEAINAHYYTLYNDIRMDKPLCGYLLDAETGKGIENAEIIIPEKAIAVSSDADGYFKLPILAPNTIHIRHQGYGAKTINPADLYVPDCPAIYLEAIVVELQEIVTQRYLATGILKGSAGELVVKPRKFGIMPGLTDPDVLQTMQQLPGVTSIDQTVSNINVRGGTHDQNLFLWNGIRMFQTSHFYGLISAFNPLQATSITIFKNGSPASYGESVSSVVDISTHADLKDDSYNVFSVDMINANFLSALKLSEKDKLQISARRTFSDLWTTPAFKNYQERVFQNTTITDVLQDQELAVGSEEKFYFYDLSLSYQRKLNERHDVSVDAIGMQNNLEVFQHSDTANRNGNLKQQNFGGGIALKSRWTEKHHSEVQGYMSWYNLDASNEAIENEQLTNQRNTILDKGLRTQYTYLATPDIKLSTGYQFNEVIITNFDEVNSPFFYKDQKEVSLSHALIGDFKYQSKTGNTIINTGIRQNYFQKFQLFLTEPRLFISQALTGKIKMELAGELKSQTVSQIIDRQQDFLGIEKRRWIVANQDDIPIQKSLQASLGFNYADNGWVVTLEGFYKKVTGITSDSQAFQNQFEFSNATGNYRVLGTEMLLQKNFKQFYTWISYGFNDNQYHFDGFLPPEFSSNFALSHAVSAAGIYEWNKLRIALGAKWHTGKPITEPSDFILDPDNPSRSEIKYHKPNNTNLEDNLQLNFAASKTWTLSENIDFSASCSLLNILNSQNTINRYYRINKTNNGVESINTYGLGRTPNISLKVIF